MRRIPQNSTGEPPIALKVYQSSDHFSAATLKTVAIQIRKPGLGFTNPSTGPVNATERGAGSYEWSPSSTDLDTLGELEIQGTCSGCDVASKWIHVVDTFNGGLTGIHHAAPGTSGGALQIGNNNGNLRLVGGALIADNGFSGVLSSVTVVGNPVAIDLTAALPGSPIAGSVGEALKFADTRLDATVGSRSTYAGADTAGTTTLLTRITAVLSIDGSGRVDIGKILGTASAGAAGYIGIDWGHVNAPTTTLSLSGTTFSTGQVVANVTGNVGGSVADVANLIIRTNTAQAGAATTITLDAGASATDGYYTNDLLQITSGTGAGQARFVTAYVGSTKVATVNSAWKTNPDNTSVFAIRPFDSIPGATAPTTAQIVTALFTALTASGDFSTPGSFGALMRVMAGMVGYGTVSDTGAAANGFIVTSPTYPLTATEAWVGKDVCFTTGNLAGQTQFCTGYATDTHRASFAKPFSQAPGNGDAFIVCGQLS